MLRTPTHRPPRGPVPGTLTVQATTGSVILEPLEGSTLRFGRNSEDVDLCVGGDDDQVSRRHGLLVRRSGTWWLSNTGRRPIELPNAQSLRPNEEPFPLPVGYTTLHVIGSRDHLLEVYVAGDGGAAPPARHRAVTRPGRTWKLSDRERLVLTALAQRYLLNSPNPQPMTRLQVAELLNDTQRRTSWTAKRVEHVIDKVRGHLSRNGVYGLRRDEVGEPVGNTLNHNLIQELLRSMTLTPDDLDLLEPPGDDQPG
ncbi:MAG: FHA domain-containing protein [Mycobacteriales bacterium]